MILIGFMGCGKTTIAQELGRRLNKEVVDLDDIIPQLAKKSIPEIFAQDGETAFRQYEFQALQKTLQKDSIISTGGGVITFDASYDYLESLKTPILFLNAPFKDLYERIQSDQNRPLGNQDYDKVHALYQSRLDRYKHLADKEISTVQTIAETADEIIDFIEKSSS